MIPTLMSRAQARSRPAAGIPSQSGTRQLQAQLAHRDDGLGAVGNAERLQYGGDVNLDGSFGEIELAADDLVRLALNYEREDLRLPLCEPEVATIGAGGGWRRAQNRRGRTPQHLGGKVDPSGEHEAQRAKQQLVGGGLGNEAHRARV